MKLLPILKQLLKEASIPMLQRDFVDKGKISQELFDKIVQITRKKASHATFFTVKIANNLIDPNDMDMWMDHLKFFERRKRDFPSADLNQYKTKEDLVNFVQTVQDLKDEEAKDPSKAKGVEKKDKYAHLLIGVIDGYKIYEFPKDSEENYNASCDIGAGTALCTSSGKPENNRYMDYIQDGPLYYIVKGRGEDKEVYAFSYARNEFKDRDNKDLFSLEFPDLDQELEEMSVTGGGAGMTPGSGAQYATPKAFKKKRGDSYDPDASSREVRRQIGRQMTQQTHTPRKGKGSYKRRSKHRNRRDY